MNYSVKIAAHALTFVILIAVSTTTYAQYNGDKKTGTLKQQVDSLCSAYLQKKGTAGLFVGIIQGDKIFAKGYGVTDRKTKKIPDSTTVFEIGSITKTFTAALAQAMVEKGELNWDDNIIKYLPDGVTLTVDDNTTLRNLASHTSGFPGLPQAWFPKIVANMCNPYSKLTMEDLTGYLRNDTDKKPPSLYTYAYSNLGMGLLGHILVWQSGKSYEELLQENICKPLNMHHTSAVKVDQSKLATAYDDKGNETCYWDLPIIPGAGAIKSNGADMLRYLQANMTNTTPISETLMKTHEPVARIQNGNVCYGWHIDVQNGIPAGVNKIIWHNGGTGGFRTYIGFIPGADKGVVVLANQYNDDLDRLAIDILLKASTVEKD